MGPGTHISERIHKGILPNGPLDAAALIHDIEYLNPKLSQQEADRNSVRNGGPLALVTMVPGYIVKDIFGYSPKQSIDSYNHLRYIVDNNPRFSTLWQRSLSWADGKRVGHHDIVPFEGTDEDWETKSIVIA